MESGVKGLKLKMRVLEKEIGQEMRNFKDQIKHLSLLTLTAILLPFSANAQLTGCASIDIGEDLQVSCDEGCITLEADVVEVGLTTEYVVEPIEYAPPFPFDQGTALFVGEDDVWSDAVTLPFDFCFFGETYNQIVVGANGVLSFDDFLAGDYCEWQFSQSLPNSTGEPYRNSINGAYHDIDPSVGGEIRYAILGEYPCRTFIVNFDQVPHYSSSCNNLLTTQQIVLYETTNIIDVYIDEKPVCSSWNSGNAVIGIQNSAGTLGYTPPARNTGPWSAASEAWRFSPDGTGVYSVTWFDEAGAVVGEGNTVEVCPTSSTTYSAEVIYDICDGTQVVETDEIAVEMLGEVSSSLTVVETCGSFSWNSVNYNSTGIYTYTTTNSQGCDSVATLDLTVHLATYSIGTAVACSEFTWNDITYTESGSYQYVGTGVNGCDSVSTLELTIVEPTTSLTVIEACESYEWNDVIYTSSGQYSYFSENSVGCDSIATLDLTINSPTSSFEQVESCGSFEWNGVEYTSSGTYVYNTVNSSGCDSTATLDLVINYPSTSVSTVISCMPYSWNGVEYATSGTYTFETLNSSGCDSTATLNLTVNLPSTSSEEVFSCSSYEWNGEVYDATGVYTYSTVNSVGCDSTATLNLTVGSPSESFESVGTCISYNWNGATYFESGTYVYETTNASGCDSTATLELTIQDYSSSLTVVSTCNEYEWNGVTYTNSGIYTYDSINYQGCDSVATLDLTINLPTSSYTSVEACESYEWNGELYLFSGSYSYFTTGSTGCDSVAYLDLVVGHPTTSLIIADACGEFEWNGELYSETGIYSFVTTNSMGCDSICTLDLFVNEIDPVVNVVEKEACNEFTWNETTYYESGEYSYTTSNIYGCDSTVYLNLTIHSDRLFIPNSFTPDNDGVNDAFYPVGEEVEMTKLYVYNRWGEIVHYSESLDEVWDGTSQGGMYLCPDGVYTYHVVYRCLTEVHEKVGHVNLFR